jgi:hypothetical protein
MYFTLTRRARDMDVPNHSPSKVERGLILFTREDAKSLPQGARGLYLSPEERFLLFPLTLSPNSAG